MGAALCFLAGCASHEYIGGSRERTESWAGPRGFRTQIIPVDGFVLFSLLRQRAGAGVLSVYIEGDGAPWPTAYRPPNDPTPTRPIALLLAERDPSPQVAYLARPCQYLGDVERANCAVAYWSSRRYVRRAVDAMDAAVTRLKESAGAGRLRLVGHSGGGVIAALLAMRRDDVDSLVTVAAPLSLAGWVARHGLSPLEDALDPVRLDAPQALPPAVHFAGAEDDVVPPSVMAEFTKRHGGRLETIAGFDHDCCWVRDWPALLLRARKLEGPR